MTASVSYFSTVKMGASQLAKRQLTKKSREEKKLRS